MYRIASGLNRFRVNKSSIIKNRFVMILFSILLSGNALSDAVITKIEGEGFEVYRAEYHIDIFEWSFLEPNDKIAINDKHTKIHLSLEGKNLVLGKNNTPYEIPEPTNQSIFGNGLKIASSIFQDYLQNQQSGKILQARGSSKPPKFYGADSKVNYFPNSLTMLRLFVEGGNSPLRVTIEGENLKDGFRAEFSGDYIGISTDMLVAGTYEISIDRVGDVEGQPIQKSIEVVSDEKLPVEVRNILSRVDSPAREQLAAILLSETKEWEFAASQFAFSAGRYELVNSILSKQ